MMGEAKRRKQLDLTYGRTMATIRGKKGHLSQKPSCIDSSA